jgi:hypothetical protein
MRRSLACLILLLVTIPFGLAARYAPLHMPWFLSKYLGSVLWAVSLYWFIAAFLPRLRPRTLLVVASGVAILVELSRLMPEPHVDAFRLTLGGKLLLGRYFSPWNIVAYLFAIALTAWADDQLHPGRGDRTHD